MAPDNALPAIDFAARRARTQGWLQEHNLTALIAISSGGGRDGHIAYLTNYRLPLASSSGLSRLEHAAYVLPADGPGILISPHDTDLADAEGVAKAKLGGDLIPDLIAVLEDAGLASERLGIAGLDLLPAAHYQALQDALPGATFAESGEILAQQRAIKDAGEAERLRLAARCADAALEAGVACLVAGTSLYRIEWAAREAACQAGAEHVAGVAIARGVVGRGPNRSAAPRETLRRGDLVCLHVGGWVAGYGFESARAGVVGNATAEQQDYLAHLAEATDWMISVLEPGIEKTFVFTESRGRRIAAAAHGIGLEIGERPWVSEGQPFTLQPGMALCVAPSVISSAFGHMAIADTVLITENGAEVLNRSNRITW